MSKAERTRERIIKAAAEAVRIRGPGRVSVAEVMTRLNLTHGGFYAHFASKDELIAAAIEEAFRDVDERRKAATEGKAPAAALAACIDWYVSAGMRDHPERACPLTTLTSEVSHMPASATSRMAEGAIRMAACLESLLRHAGLPEPETQSLSVAAEMVGAVSLARTVPDQASSDRFLSTTRTSLKQRLGLPT